MNEDKSGSFYTDEPSRFEELNERGYIINLIETIKGRNGTNHLSMHFIHDSFTSLDSPYRVDLARKLEDYMERGLDVTLYLVERRYETGSEGESPDRSFWARPEYKVIKKLTREELSREISDNK